MNQQFIVPALLILALSFVVLTGFCVYGYRALRQQFDQLVFDGEKVASLSENLIEAAKQFDRFCSHLRELERHENVQPDARMAPASANPNSRSQVMRLHRSGESISSIASALGVSQGEVKLMVKVQELLSENGSGERSPDFL
jgi:DNA-binding NarL/FixJ family response regulator